MLTKAVEIVKIISAFLSVYPGDMLTNRGFFRPWVHWWSCLRPNRKKV